MKLHLLRHAKTDKNSVSGCDFDRKLMGKGNLQANEMAKFLTSKNWEETVLFCSAAKRTKETFEYIQKKNKFKVLSFHQSLYLAELKDLLEFIWKLDSKNDLFIVGHNNGLSDLATYFLGEDTHLKTCTYLRISFEAEFSSEWSRDLGIIQEVYRPEV